LPYQVELDTREEYVLATQHFNRASCKLRE